jgi:hypothetical protein
MGLWWEVRVLAKDHGRQFYWRIQQYSSVFFLSTLALLAFLIYQLVVGTAETATIVLIDFDVLALLFIFIILVSKIHPSLTSVLFLSIIVVLDYV